MGERTRRYNWAQTSVGSPAIWPQSLRTTVSNLLRSRFPMFLWWGDDMIQFYNDAYRPSMGMGGKHPEALGQKAEACWPEIWDIIFPLIRKVKTTGEPTWSENQLIPIYRNGNLEDVYWTFSYSLVLDDDDEPAGVLVTCMETTETVLGRKKVEESEERFRTMAEGTDILIALADETSSATYFNKAWVNLTGRSVQDLLSYGWVDLVHPEDIEQYLKIYFGAFERQQPFSGEFRMLSKEGDYHWLLAKAPVRFRPDGSFAGYISSCVDITERKKAEEETRKLVSVIEASHEFIGIAGVDTVIQYGNPAALRMLGWDGVEGKDILDCVHPDDEELATEVLDHLLTHGHSSKEIRFLNQKTGEPFWVQWNSVTIKDPDSGQIVGLATVSPDITSRKKAGEALKDSEAKFRSLIEEAPVATCLFVGPEMVIEIANGPMLKAWGKTPAVIGKKLAEAVPELEGQPFSSLLDEVYRTGKSFEAKAAPAYLKVDGEKKLYYFDYTYKPILDANGKVYAIMDMAVDVTTQVHSKKALEESESNLKNMILQAPVAMCILKGPTFIVEIANEFMLEIWGKTYPELLHKPIFETLPEARADYEELLQHVFSTGQTYRAYESPATLPGAGKLKTVYIDLVYEAFREADGTVSGIMAVAVDVTQQVIARHKIEEVVMQRTRELAEANKTLRQTNQELEQFAFVASHDLQEPLRKVSTFTEMLKTHLGAVDERSKMYLGKISESSERMLQLIRDVLNFSQLSNKQQVFQTVNLVELVNSLVSDFEVVIQQKNAVIQYDNLPILEANAVQMRQLAGNLLSNALKFTKENVPPKITITAALLTQEEKSQFHALSPHLDYYHIQVADNGIGFSEKYLGKIFGIFQRLHARTTYEGTGIGLALCKKIAHNHHGDIWANSEPGCGATFHILLPRKMNRLPKATE